MALGETLTLTSPVKAGSTDLAWIWDNGVPDGSQSPQSDARKGSLYTRLDATADQSPLYVKVDLNSSQDDWVNVMVDKDEAARTMEGNLTIDTDTKVYFRDTGLYLYSPADGELMAVTDGQFLVSGGSGLRLDGDAEAYKELYIGPHVWDVSSSGSLVLGVLQHTGTGCYPALQFSGCGDLTAYADVFKVPTDAASSGSVRAAVVWSGSTDGDAAVFRVGYDYIATGEGPGTSTGSVVLAGSCVDASHFTSSSIGDLPSFTQHDYVAIRLQHVGSSASDDSGSTTDVLGMTLRYKTDRLGETV